MRGSQNLSRAPGHQGANGTENENPEHHDDQTRAILAWIIIAPGFQESRCCCRCRHKNGKAAGECKDLPEAHALPKFHKFHFEMKRCIRGNDTTCATGTVGELRRNN